MHFSQFRMSYQEFRYNFSQWKPDNESWQATGTIQRRKIEVADKITINGSNVINHGTLNAHELNFIDARILNKADLNSDTNIKLNGCRLFNYGSVRFDETDGKTRTNNSTATVIINHYEARISGYEIEGGLSVYNDGFIETSKFTNSSSDVLYNSCTVIVKRNSSSET